MDILDEKSSLISSIEWDDSNDELTVYFKSYYTDKIIHEGVTKKIFEQFGKEKSVGKYYLNFIKPNFKQSKKQSMSNQPKGINIAKGDVRWIDMSIDVTKIKKEWLTTGLKGTYLNLKLRMLPDGEVDKYECLGFLVQQAPTEIYKAAEAKQKGSGKELKGEILGNAKELDWNSSNNEGIPGQQGGTLVGENSGVADDIPF